jgi:hypothetical protein
MITRTSVWVIVTTACFLVCYISTGCSLLTPGLDTRVAAESRSTTSWDMDSNLQIDESTTHNKKTVAAEGENVTAEYYDTGVPKKITGATQILSQVSEPRDVMEAYMKLAGLNLEMGRDLVGMIKSIAPRLMASVDLHTATGALGDLNLPEMVGQLTPDERAQIVAELQRRFQNLPAPATQPR